MLDQMIWGNSLQDYLISIIIVLLFFGLGKLFSVVIVKFLRRMAEKTETMLDDILINVLEKPLVFALFIAGLYFASRYLTFSARGSEIFWNIFEILVVLNILWAVLKLFDAIVEFYLKPVVSKSESKLDDQMLPFAKAFVKAIIIIIGAIFLIRHFGYDVTSLLAGLGIGGLAFALAAQPLLTNLFGGLSIIADKPFHIGDRIRIDQKWDGVVKEMGMRSTTIETLESTKVIIPNSIIAASALENITREKARKITVNLGLTYDTSARKIEEGMSIIKNVLEKNPYVVHDDADCKPTISFNEFKDSSLNILVIFYIKDLSNLLTARTQINLAIKQEFEDASIEFAYPTHTVYVKNEAKMEAHDSVKKVELTKHHKA